MARARHPSTGAGPEAPRHPASERSPSGRRGFSLIELMVVVAILGILASIAYPSYLEYVKRARRADAQAALTELAGAMERWFADNNRYEDLDSRGVFPKYVPLGEPEDHASYELKIDLVSGGYRLTADPDVGNSPMKDDRFGCAVLTSAGLRGWDTDPDCDGGDGLEILGWD